MISRTSADAISGPPRRPDRARRQVRARRAARTRRRRRAVEHAFVDHVARAVEAFLARLEHEPHGSRAARRRRFSEQHAPRRRASQCARRDRTRASRRRSRSRTRARCLRASAARPCRRAADTVGPVAVAVEIGDHRRDRFTGRASSRPRPSSASSTAACVRGRLEAELRRAMNRPAQLDDVRVSSSAASASSVLVSAARHGRSLRQWARNHVAQPRRERRLVRAVRGAQRVARPVLCRTELRRQQRIVAHVRERRRRRRTNAVRDAGRLARRALVDATSVPASSARVAHAAARRTGRSRARSGRRSGAPVHHAHCASATSHASVGRRRARQVVGPGPHAFAQLGHPHAPHRVAERGRDRRRYVRRRPRPRPSATRRPTGSSFGREAPVLRRLAAAARGPPARTSPSCARSSPRSTMRLRARPARCPPPRRTARTTARAGRPASAGAAHPQQQARRSASGADSGRSSSSAAGCLRILSTSVARSVIWRRDRRRCSRRPRPSPTSTPTDRLTDNGPPGTGVPRGAPAHPQPAQRVRGAVLLDAQTIGIDRRRRLLRQLVRVDRWRSCSWAAPTRSSRRSCTRPRTGCCSATASVNDWVGRWLLGFPSFTPIDSYRRGHMAHHREEFGPDEPDIPLYRGYPISNGPRCAASSRATRPGSTGWKLFKGLLRGVALDGPGGSRRRRGASSAMQLVLIAHRHRARPPVGVLHLVARAVPHRVARDQPPALDRRARRHAALEGPPPHHPLGAPVAGSPGSSSCRSTSAGTSRTTSTAGVPMANLPEAARRARAVGLRHRRASSTRATTRSGASCRAGSAR